MQGYLTRAELTDNWPAIKAFHQESRQDLELLGKLLGELKDTATVNVLILPEWQTLRAAILSALAPYPQARIAVAETLQKVGNGLSA